MWVSQVDRQKYDGNYRNDSVLNSELHMCIYIYYLYLSLIFACSPRFANLYLILYI